MRAAVFERLGDPIVVRELADPEPGPSEVLVRIEASGVCYTDLRLIDGSPPGVERQIVPGHEPVGVVAAVGDEAADTWSVGDRVAVHALFSCGTCDYCRRGEEEACVHGFTRLAGFGLDGGYAEYLAAPADHVVPLPDAISFTEAAPFCCAGLTVYAALRNGGIEPGQRVAVLGIGGLGHLAISIAAALGAEVYAVTGSEDKVALALERGAAWAGDAEAAAAVLAERGGAQIVLNTANALEPVGQLVPGVAKQGAIVLTAADGEQMPVPLSSYIGQQLRVIGSFFGSARDLREVLELAAEHGIRPQVEVYPLDEVNEVHARLRANDVRFRAVLTPSL